MSVEMQTRSGDLEVDTPPWHVRLAVVWRDEELPVPITDRSRDLARQRGVRLAARPGSCIAHFAIAFTSAEEAVVEALRFWSSVVDEASLPNWEIVSFSIDQVDVGDILDLN